MSEERKFGSIARSEITQVDEHTPVPEGSAPIVGATLTVLRGPEAGRLLYVGSMGGVIGRGDEAEMEFSDSAISRRHARLTLRDGQFYLRDLDSVNGTFVDDQRVLDAFQLPPLCRIRVGRHTVLQFAAVDERGREREYQRVLVEERLRFEEEKGRALARQADELQRANADLGQLVHALTHQLREPLGRVLERAQQLNTLHGAQLDATGVLRLRELVAAAEEVRAQLDDLARFSELGELGGLDDLALDAVVDEALAERAEAIRASGARIERHPLPRVAGDRATLRQLVGILVDNALAYRGDREPRLALAAERDGDDWVIAVTDAGTGIPAGETARVFEMLYRVAGDGEPAGSGIGLAIARRIVELHGGRIWIESEPGAGTTVRFTLRPAFEG